MRTVKASEVVKGMRVQVQRVSHNVIMTIEGDVCQATHSANSALVFEDGTSHICGRDEFVTVLAEPEPEWVEGAWYWTHAKGQEKPAVRRRLARGWASGGSDSEIHTYTDMHDGLTVLGRVLIVDWPGDLAAQSLLVRGATKSPCDSGLPDDVAEAVDNVADAIRTQGGVR